MESMIEILTINRLLISSSVGVRVRNGLGTLLFRCQYKLFDNCIFYFDFWPCSFRYPYDEAATVAISTVKEFGKDLKEVSGVHVLLHVQIELFHRPD